MTISNYYNDYYFVLIYFPMNTKYVAEPKGTWVQNHNLYSVDQATPTSVVTYWRYVLKREHKARQYH